MAGNTKRASIDFDVKTNKAQREIEQLAKSMGSMGTVVGSIDSKIGGIQNSFNSLKPVVAIAAFQAITGAITAAIGAVVEWSQESQRVQGVFGNLKFGIDAARDSTLGLVSDMDLATAANNAAATGAATSAKEFANLSEIAVKLAYSQGLELTGAVDGLSEAIGKNSAEILNNYGVLLTVPQAQAKLAAQLGKEVSALTESEMATAFKTIALQELKEKADQVTIAEGSLAMSMVKTTVAAENAKHALQGADDAHGRLASAVASLDANFIKEHANLQRNKSELWEVRKALEKAGISYDELKDKTVVVAAVTKQFNAILRDEQNAAAQQQARVDAERQALLDAAVKDAENDVRIQQAIGVRDRGAIQAGKQALLDAQREAGKITEEEFEFESMILDLERSRTDEVKKRTGARKEEFTVMVHNEPTFTGVANDFGALQIEANFERQKEAEQKLIDAKWEMLDAEIEMEERRIELMRARGQETTALEDQLMMFRESELRALGAVEDAEKVAHDRRVEMAKREQELEAEKWKQTEKITGQSIDALAQATIAAANATEAKGVAFANEIAAYAKSQAIVLAIDAAKHEVLAAAAAISFNYPKAAAEAAAGAKSAAGAIALGGVAAAFGAAAGGMGMDVGGLSSGGGNAFNLGGGGGAANSGLSAPENPLSRPGGGSTAMDSQIPADARAGNLTVIVQGSVLSQQELLKTIRDSRADGIGV